MSWVFAALLACAVLVLIGAEWPRLRRLSGLEERARRRRGRRKQRLRLVSSESEEFAASVRRDLERLPTIEEQEPHR
ncbi:MAG: hypothetical protein C4305_09875 [Thermoleophilia bacterium]